MLCTTLLITISDTFTKHVFWKIILLPRGVDKIMHYAKTEKCNDFFLITNSYSYFESAVKLTIEGLGGWHKGF